MKNDAENENERHSNEVGGGNGNGDVNNQKMDGMSFYSTIAPHKNMNNE